MTAVVRSFVRLFVCSFVRLFVCSFVCLFVHLFVCSFVQFSSISFVAAITAICYCRNLHAIVNHISSAKLLSVHYMKYTVVSLYSPLTKMWRIVIKKCYWVSGEWSYGI